MARTIRKNEKIGLKSEILNFIPSINQSIELMKIKITNINDGPTIFSSFICNSYLWTISR